MEKQQKKNASITTSTTTLKKKHPSISVCDTVQYYLIEISLLHIESSLSSLHKPLQSWNVECHLLIDKLISPINSPVYLWFRHIKVLYVSTRSFKAFSYEMEAIIIDLILHRMGNMRNALRILKIVLQVITEMIFTLLPQFDWINRRTLDQNDDKHPV